MANGFFPPTLDEQIAEVEREIKMREQVYPGMVRLKKLSQVKADRQIAVMKAVLGRLRQFQAED
jgi:hypothetical protein